MRKDCDVNNKCIWKATSSSHNNVFIPKILCRRSKAYLSCIGLPNCDFEKEKSKDYIIKIYWRSQWTSVAYINNMSSFEINLTFALYRDLDRHLHISSLWKTHDASIWWLIKKPSMEIAWSLPVFQPCQALIISCEDCETQVRIVFLNMNIALSNNPLDQKHKNG